MPGLVKSWSPWPQLTLSTAGPIKADNIEYFQDILSQYPTSSLQKSWIEVCNALFDVTEKIALKGASFIPDITFESFMAASDEERQKLKDIGCFVVRGVVPKQQAETWSTELKKYVEDNMERVSGFPQDTPFMYNVYHSPAQQAARSHPNSLAVQRKVNELWHDRSGVSTAQPLSYADGFRMRPAKTEFRGLPPHIDCGSLSRWADSAYRSVYHAIWSGNPNLHDPYDLSTRAHAKPGLFPGTSSQVLRAFQGWTALTTAGPREGSLLLYPNVKAAIAYILLRPFFTAPENEADIMDATKWSFNADKAWFPGTWRHLPQIVSPASHPHLRLEECLVNIPVVHPGDTVWWHADMIHGVDFEHNGNHDSSVLYIAAVPSTPDNVRYIRQQVRDFEAGIPPEDFREAGTDERQFVGYRGIDGITSAEGKEAAGSEL